LRYRYNEKILNEPNQWNYHDKRHKQVVRSFEDAKVFKEPKKKERFKKRVNIIVYCAVMLRWYKDDAGDLIKWADRKNIQKRVVGWVDLLKSNPTYYCGYQDAETKNINGYLAHHTPMDSAVM